MYFQLEVVNSVIKLREWANTWSAAWQLRSWRGRSGPGPSPWRHPPDGCRDGRHGRGRLDHQGDQRGAVPVPPRILRLLVSRVRRRILEVSYVLSKEYSVHLKYILLHYTGSLGVCKWDYVSYDNFIPFKETFEFQWRFKIILGTTNENPTTLCPHLIFRGQSSRKAIQINLVATESQ